MSEVVASNGVGSSNVSNKRKRRSSFDEIDIENKRPAKKPYTSPTSDDDDSASDLENDRIDMDLYAIGPSPQPINRLQQKVDGVEVAARPPPRSISSSKRTTTTNNHSSSNFSSILDCSTKPENIPEMGKDADSSGKTIKSNVNNNISSNNNNVNSNINNNNNNSEHKDCNGQNVTLTPNSNGGAAIHATELTPQSIRKTDAWNRCTKCCPRLESRTCPLPALSWANAKDVWHYMCEKDKKTSVERRPKMLNKHQGLQPRMRAILLDWLNEVCGAYNFHRETYYLALDYLDRYLSTNVKICKNYLQLIGITCLFIAAKVEEIYPPKLSEFAYVTDGACSEDDILKQELVILSALKWRTCPITIIGWLGVYMQLNVSRKTPKNIDGTPAKQQNTNADETDDGFVFPQFSGVEYAQTAQLIDLCTLDIGIANFAYSVIAAAAISHTFNEKTAIKLSGLDWETISPCARWMEPYFQICARAPRICLQEKNEQFDSKHGLHSVCPNMNSDDSHILQMHTTNMEMFDEAAQYREQRMQEASPAPMRTHIDHICPPEGLLTPPDSSRKFTEA